MMETKETELGALPTDWEVVPLLDIGMKFFGGGTPSTTRPEYWNGSIPWTTSAYLDGLYVTRGIKGITQIGLDRSSSNLVPKGNLVIGTRVGTGKVAVTAIDVAISQDLTGVILNQNKVHSEFIAYFLASEQAQQYFRAGTRGVTIKGIPRDDLIKIPVPLPSIPEQRTIARILSTIQRTIKTEDNLITAARELKKSLMQKLFTQGLNSNSVVKETEIGMMPEHWQIVTIGDTGTTTQYGISLRGGSKGEYPILRMNNLKNGKVDTSDLQYVDLSEDEFGKVGVAKGDILFNRTNSFELVGKTSLFELEGEYVFASYLVRAKTNEEKLSSHFLNQYMNWEIAQSRLKTLATRGVSQSNISASKLRGFAISLPRISEQREIARILTAVDKKIENEEKRKAALEALFNTMLQQLMTGQIRVTDSSS